MKGISVLCGFCNNKAVGYGRLAPGNAHPKVCDEHKDRVTDLVLYKEHHA